jgi:hypothetical protein
MASAVPANRLFPPWEFALRAVNGRQESPKYGSFPELVRPDPSFRDFAGSSMGRRIASRIRARSLQ